MLKNNLGHYSVGNKKFLSKISALIEASATHQNVEWWFHNETWKNVNWKTPVDISINELYRIRAQQLRDSYDYLILYFSGGADSTNILETFLKNNIFIDEVVIMLPGIDRKNFKDNDTSPRNLYGEIEFVAIPYIKKNSHRFNSNTKITIADFSYTLKNFIDSPYWAEKYDLGIRMSPAGLSWQLLDLDIINNLKKLDSSKKICKIYGCDKPLLNFKDNNYYIWFNDVNVYHCNPVELNFNESINTTSELFYWSPMLPEIVVKQAQLIKKECENNDFLKFLWSLSLKKHIGIYRNFMHPIIYPNIESPKFQTGKQVMDIIKDDGSDDWFWSTITQKQRFNFLESVFYKKKLIDSKYLVDHTSVKNFSTNTFYIGPFKL